MPPPFTRPLSDAWQRRHVGMNHCPTQDGSGAAGPTGWGDASGIAARSGLPTPGLSTMLKSVFLSLVARSRTKLQFNQHFRGCCVCQMGMVHRDLKPENVLVNEQGQVRPLGNKPNDTDAQTPATRPRASRVHGWGAAALMQFNFIYTNDSPSLPILRRQRVGR